MENADVFERSPLAERIKTRTRQYLEDGKRELQRALSVCLEPDGPQAYEENIRHDLMLVEGLLQTETYEGLQKKMESLSFKRLAPNRRKDGSEEKAFYGKAVRE